MQLSVETSPGRARARGEARKRQARTVIAQARFLREFAWCGNVRWSAAAVHVGRRTVYNWLGDPGFKTRYDEAHEEALDRLYEEARRRAVDGWLVPIVSAGKLVTHVRRYSDRLLIFLLKTKRPEIYDERFREPAS